MPVPFLKRIKVYIVSDKFSIVNLDPL